MAEKCPNLTHLNLSGNKIKDLSTIEPLVSHLGPSPPQGGRGEGLVSGTTTFTFVEYCFSVVPPCPMYLTLFDSCYGPRGRVGAHFCLVHRETEA